MSPNTYFEGVKEVIKKEGLHKRMTGKVLLFDELIFQGNIMRGITMALRSLGVRPLRAAVFCSKKLQIPHDIFVGYRLSESGGQRLGIDIGTIWNDMQNVRHLRKLRRTKRYDFPSYVAENSRSFVKSLKRVARRGR